MPDQLSDETMRLMREKQIYAVPTFTISGIFCCPRRDSPEEAALEHQELDYHVQQFHRQLEHGVPMAVGSDVGPFPHGTQARELELMVQYGMKPLEVLKADLLNGARLLDWEHDLGALKAGYDADIIAVPGNPLDDIRVLEHVSFVMKGGTVYRR